MLEMRRPAALDESEHGEPGLHVQRGGVGWDQAAKS